MPFQPPLLQPKASSDPATARLVPSRLHLAEGPWAAELVGDELAYVSYNDKVILRAVKAVVRSKHWQTPQPHVTMTETAENENVLDVHWAVKYSGYGIQYEGSLRAIFTPTALEVSFKGNAVHAFESNRIGLVVLHPPADAGRPVIVEHPDGSRTQGSFPVDISPDQPFTNIGALQWVDADTGFRLSFTGDVFETEDQRNWTDGSFKTYSTPLARPFPVFIPAGASVHQSVRLEAAPLQEQAAEHERGVVACAGRRKKHTDQSVNVRLGGHTRTVPALAVGAGSEPGRLSALPCLDAILVELTESRGSIPRRMWADQLHKALAAATILGTRLDVRAVTSDVASAVAELRPHLPMVKRVAVFHPETHLSEAGTWPDFTTELQAAGFEGELVTGVRSHFTELNRNISRIPIGSKAVTFSITPQMHSVEVAHIIESIPMQGLVVQNALRLAPGSRLHVGPVTLRPRFNAVATAPVQAEAETDDLQSTTFAAAWTLASLNALSLEGVASVTYFEAAGPRGVADTTGRLYPVGELLKELAVLRGCEVLDTNAPADTAITLYPVQAPDGVALFAGNLSAAEVTVNVILPNGVTTTSNRCISFGEVATSALNFKADDEGNSLRGRLTLKAWSSGMVLFPKTR